MTDFIEQIFIYLGSFGGFIFFTGLIFQNILLILLGIFIFTPMIFAYFVFKLIPIYGDLSQTPLGEQYEQPKRTGKSVFGESAEGLGTVNDQTNASTTTSSSTSNSSSNSTSSGATVDWEEPNNNSRQQTRRTAQQTNKSDYKTRQERQKQRRQKRQENRKRWREYNRRNSTSASDTGSSSTQTHTLSREERKEYRKQLQIEKGYSESELKTAYRNRIKETHPDMDSGSEEEFKAVQTAYEELQKII